MTWPVLTILVLGIWHGINPGMGWLFAVALGMQQRERRSVWLALLPLAAGHALAIASTLVVALLVGAIVPPAILKWAIAMLLVAFGASRMIRGRHPRYGGMRMSMRRLTVWSFLMASAHGAGLMVIPFVLADPAARIEGDNSASAVDAVGNGSGAAGQRIAGDDIATVIRSGGEARGGEIGLAGNGGPRPHEHWEHEATRGARSRNAGAHGEHSEHLAGLADSGPTEGWLVLLVHTAGYLFATGLLAVLVYEKLGLRMLRTVWLNLDLIWGFALAATGVIAPFV